MNRKDLYKSFSKVDDNILERSELQGRKNISVWRKWGVLAACICLLIGVVPVVLINSGKGGSGSQDDFPHEAALLYFQGALYSCCDLENGLERMGLPPEITSEMAGEHVAYLELGGFVDYQETAKQTDKELFQYASAPTRAVYILRDGENYMAVVFARTFFPDDRNAYCDLAEVYRFYDISDASDIVSIAKTDWNRGKVIGAKITDVGTIEEFLAYTTDVTKFISMDNDTFQRQVFSGIPEEEQPEAHTAFADDLQVIRIETKDGFLFYLHYYPNYGYLYSGQAMAYHQVTPELRSWFETNMGIK